MFIQDIKKLPKISVLPKLISIDTETKPDGSIEGLSFAYRSKKFNKIKGYYIPLQHRFPIGCNYINLEKKQVMEYFQQLVKDRRCIFHNAQFDLTILYKNFNIKIPEKNVEDTLLLHWVINTNRRHGLKEIRRIEYGREDLIKYKDAKSAGIDSFVLYGENDAIETLALFEDLMEQVKPLKKTYNLYRNYEIPFVKVMQEINYYSNYIRVDEPKLLNFVKLAKKEIDLVNFYLKDALGDINFGSSKQLAKVLIEKGYKLEVKRETGNYILDEGAIERLHKKQGGLVLDLLIYNRGINKLDNTYVSKLYELLEQVDEDVYILSGYKFNPTGTNTGRLAGSNPNMQNIPRDKYILRCLLLNELKKLKIVKSKVLFLTDALLDDILDKSKDNKKIAELIDKYSIDMRAVFIPMPNRIFIDADYSQIELRMMAHLSNDPKMVEAYCTEGADFHQATADGINKIVGKEVVTRQSSKTINFFFQYGGYYKTLAKRLGITESVAKLIDSAYNKNFKVRSAFIESIYASARKSKFVQTILGRRQFIPNIMSDNFFLRNHDENSCISHVVSGSSADLIKIAMINLYKYKDLFNIKLQVHDELLIEVDKKNVKKALKIVKYEMENAMKLRVPVLADAKIGTNWRECH